MRNHKMYPVLALAVVVGAAASRASYAQTSATHSAPAGIATAATNSAAPVVPPPDYVIGPDDQLSVVFWRDKDMSADVVVRPDGKISLPLLNEVQAAGFTPEELRARLVEAASKYVEEPTATVVVKEIHSRNAFITGNVMKPGTYVLATNMTVLQLIAVAGGLQEYADDGNIVIMRSENGRLKSYKFNYKDVVKQKRPQQNIVLRPGDTVVVP